MSNDDFESSEGYSTSSITYKYAQLSVPDFGYDTTSTTTSAATTGSSFVRLGSFPSLSDTSTATLDGIVDGLANSYNLVALVADTSQVTDYSTAVDEPTTDEWGAVETNPYGGDSDYVVGFMDDYRSREDASDSNLYIDSADTTNSTTARKTETQRLSSKGGWWDHTDGNRIVTTGGDKIEIIQGNFKQFVLGRQASTGAVSDLDSHLFRGTDISGGYDSSKLYEWLSSEGMWAVYDASGAKHAYKESHGVDVSVFTGTYKVSITGEDSDSDENDPKVISKTWASATESYSGSAEKPIPHSYSLSYVLEKEDVAFQTTSHSVKLYDFGISLAFGDCVVDTKVYGMGIGINILPLSISVLGSAVGLDMKLGQEWTYSCGIEKKDLLEAPKADVVKTELTAKETIVATTDTPITQEETTIVASEMNQSVQHWMITEEHYILNGIAFFDRVP